MADPNDDEWLYGSGGDNPAEEEQEEPENEEVDGEETTKVANVEKTFETTYDEHNFEVTNHVNYSQ